jgi:hypothetical protein
VSNAVAREEGIAAVTPLGAFCMPAGVDGVHSVLGAGLLTREVVLEAGEGLLEGAVARDEVLDVGVLGGGDGVA